MNSALLKFTKLDRPLLALVLPCLFAALTNCAVNPATGERELSLVSEQQEIQMGLESDPAATSEFGGLYDDPELQNYISSLGHSIARVSERPELPWSFKLVNDDLINAFALPGGFIYITRGILANMNSEAELVAVLGHEVGHVTARHAAQQMTQQQLGMIGFMGGAIFSETVRNNADIIMQGLQLLSLKYGRDDEAQSDELGYRYMLQTGYDPHGISNVMSMLASTSPSSDDAAVPTWLLSHPEPAARVAANEERMANDNRSFEGLKLGREEFLMHLDGLIYGVDPRQGYFIDKRFIQPELSFEVTFPDGWRTQNGADSVQAGSTTEDAIIQLTISDAASPQEALSRFLQQENLSAGQPRNQTINGLTATGAEFSVSPPEGQQAESMSGYVMFIAHNDTIYRILGYSRSSVWAQRAQVISSTMNSFKNVTEQQYKNVSPDKLKIVTLDRDMTGTQFLEIYPSAVPAEEVFLVNQINGNQQLSQGQLMKQVVGGQFAFE